MPSPFRRQEDMDRWSSPEPESRIEAIRELVDELPEDEQLAVSLMYFGGGNPTNASVADDMGISEYRTKELISRGLERLQEALQEEDLLGALLPDD